ncbi:uncharacterized protein LOC6596941 [Drosophila persimilis]|nr:uncharacterized protein LOC6596941 [Drosophila persimilis]
MILYTINFLIFYTASAHNLEVPNYQNPAKKIVQDLIDSWQSPIGYLESRGYLPKDIQYVPDLNFDTAQKNSLQDWPQNDLSQKQYQESPAKANAENAIREMDPALAETDRLVRSFDEQDSDELKKMFDRLFSSKNDDTISDEIKSKLDVSWDMNQIKTSALREANKRYEKFCIKRTQNEPLSTDTDEQFDSAIDAEIAELYPSVLSKKDDIKNNDMIVASPDTKLYHLIKGYGKILGNRELGDKAIYKQIHLAQNKTRRSRRRPSDIFNM